MAEKEKDDVIDKVISEIDKKYGKGTIMKRNSEADNSIKRTASGSMGLDMALGGGWPRGRIIELFGPESSGKTTVALHAIAEVQKDGELAAFVDTEHAIDFEYSERLGVDIDKLLVSQPDNGEQALDIVESLIQTGKVSMIVVDSVAALTPKAEIEGEMGESKMGLQARLMSQALRKIVGIVNKTNTCVIFTNQLRDKIGVMFGNPETTTGGNALKFYASIRCDIRRTAQNKDGDEVISNKTKVKVVKNKTAAPFKNCEFNIVFNEGIDTIAELVELCVTHGIVSKSGSWYAYGDTKLGQGADKVKEVLLDNPELTEELSNKLREKLNIK